MIIGKVKVAFHKETNKRVAIRIISKTMLVDRPAFAHTLSRGITVLKLLNHPHIVKLYGVMETSDYMFDFQYYINFLKNL